MTTLRVTLKSIQHISSLAVEVDLDASGLVCVVGRNGAGKTTLVRALRNLSNADTFVRTASPRAFSKDSEIIYEIDRERIVFSYDEGIRSINCKGSIPKGMRDLISAELPMPHGNRFNYFKSASEADLDIRKALALTRYTKPEELIEFLTAIYGTALYSNLAEVKHKGKSYFAIVREDGTYIREDYLSSGEYFLINLYRSIKGSAKLIVIDEIDLSLDAAAQAKMSDWLRSFAIKYERTILFTTHSLAVMQTLEDSELNYMEVDGGNVSIQPASFSYVKARLFGFKGWDRYILTEDVVLLGFIEAIIAKFCPDSFFSHKIVFVGGAPRVVDLMKHNAKENFLAPTEHVIAILDGDQKDQKFAKSAGIYVTPIESVEKAVYADSQSKQEFPFKTDRKNFTSEKDFYNFLQQKKIATASEIDRYLIDANNAALQPLVEILRAFLSARPL
ncbi:AAA family ATPase [Xanthomonas sp. NCPPB 2632]|uniref:AAA family ATPase n=1 Tax=Xanthomonas sp. NCPPB 2632 TaxID=3240912 RepID=UPI0035173CD8